MIYLKNDKKRFVQMNNKHSPTEVELLFELINYLSKSAFKSHFTQ